MCDSEWYEQARLESYQEAGALAAALRWLGDRYLLAKSITRRKR